LDNQTLALAGVFQSATLVDKIAKTGQVDSELLENALQTILNLNPSSYEDVFKSRENLQTGLSVISISSCFAAFRRKARGLKYGILFSLGRLDMARKPHHLSTAFYPLKRGGASSSNYRNSHSIRC
ncbi:MAG: DUF489 family protein, partial [Okeania sp. SIO4D6]|nr:DUF489 family protein [Okeania sp. SIO4D6]